MSGKHVILGLTSTALITLGMVTQFVWGYPYPAPIIFIAAGMFAAHADIARNRKP